MRLRLVPIAVLTPFLLLMTVQPAPSADDEAGTRILKLLMSEFVPVRPGDGSFPAEFVMGSTEGGTAAEKPAHPVRMRTPFAIARYEVTQELYEVIVGKNPSRWKGTRNSVEMTSWPDAVTFCRKVTEELRRRKLLSEKEEIRLPSEAEWEYSCRAGSKTKFGFGDDASQLGEYAWFSANSKGEDPPVGRKKPNAWGLYDMHGYISEWCQDAWHDNYQGAPADGSAWAETTADHHVARGGSFADPPESCRCATRYRLETNHRSDRVGFRCVKAAVPGGKE